jgi:exonuclease VII large subunit
VNILEAFAQVVRDHEELKAIVEQAKKQADPATRQLLERFSNDLNEQMETLKRDLPRAVELAKKDLEQAELEAHAAQAEMAKAKAKIEQLQAEGMLIAAPPMPAAPTPPPPPEPVVVDPRLADRLREEVLRRYGYWKEPPKPVNLND